MRLFHSLCLLTVSMVIGATSHAGVLISEFVAANATGLVDEDGDRPDWLEVYNDGADAVSLSGWFLTDEEADRVKWTLPAVTLGGRQSLVVFASGKDRAVAGQPLHTSFKLSASGGYLALVRPDRTVASEWRDYPAQFTDRSYGLAQAVSRTDFLAANAPARHLVPTDDSLGRTWTSPGFNDAAWPVGTSGFGYEPTVAGFAVRVVIANVPVSSNAVAQTVRDTPAQQSGSGSENRAFVDYWNTGGTGRYSGNFAAPQLPAGTDVENYVMEAIATVTIPTAGAWTFGVNSNDGFLLTVGPFTSSFNAERSAADTLAPFTFPAAGEYPLRLLTWSAIGGGEVELFAAPGTFGAWSAGPFDRVGDTANGGLVVRAPLAGTEVSALTPHIRTQVGGVLKNVGSSLYARFPFSVPNPSAVSSLVLPIRYDDGAVIYLNGVEITRLNAPAGPLTHATTAIAARSNTDAVTPVFLNLSPHLGLLLPGPNTLAIHGLNLSPADNDFLLQPELSDLQVATGVAHSFATPTPGAFNTAAVYNHTAPIVASQAAGFFSAPFSLTLTSSPGATIHHTYDGSTPTAASAVLAGPITIDRTTTVRAVALLAGAEPSPVFTRTFLFLADVITQSPAGQRPVVQNPPGSPAATTLWPASGVNGQVLQYGMDPNVVNQAPDNATILADLQAVPTISIVTDLRNLFDANDGIYVNATSTGDTAERPISIEFLHPDGREGFQENCGLRIRGNFSRAGNNPKHSFRCFFRSEYGAGRLRFPFFGPDGADEHDVIDFRTAQDRSWAFLGNSNALFVGDLFARDLLGAMGQPTTRGNFYHLYLNGQYWGLYDSEERINPSFSATYLGGTEDDFDIIKTNNLDIETAAGSDADWRLLWEKTEASTVASAAGYQELLGNHPDGTRNPAVPVLIDPVSLADYMLMNFYIDNQDGPTYIDGQQANNFFAVRNRNAGVGWRFLAHDSEYALFSLSRDITGPYGVGASYQDSNPRRFFERLIPNPEFRQLFADRVQKHCFNGGPLTETGAAGLFQQRKAEADRAVVGESARWGDAQREPAFTRDDTWLSEINYYLSTWFPQRTGILLGHLRTRGYFPTLAAPVFMPRGGTVAFGAGVALTNPNPSGVIYFTTDGSDPRAVGGNVAATAQAVGSPIAINGSRLVRARVKDGSTWSALDEARFYAAQDFGALALTEIHYNPAPGGSAGEAHEFVELKNTGSSTLDLGGTSFTNGIAATFATGSTLAPGGFAVLVRDRAAFAARHPDVPVAGTFTGKLDNAGESLTLSHPAGTPILQIAYGDNLPWPLAADGFGFSLVPQAGGVGWRASALVDGSPGRDDPEPLILPVVISEALSRSSAPRVDFIELFNPSGTPADVSHWWLSDDSAAPQKYRLPPGSIIPSGGFLVVEQPQFDPNPDVPPSFALSADGDTVLLASGDAAGALTGYTHGFKFQAADQDVSFGRFLNSGGDESWPASLNPTPGAANAGPSFGPVVINEIQYHPAAGEDQFVEIRNLLGTPVDLFDAIDPFTPWRIDGLGFSFPPNTTLAAHSLGLVVNADPVAFRLKYAVPAAVPIFGPWGGALQDDGERLSLEKPYGPPAGTPPEVKYIVVDPVRYHDTAPWPPAADGSGPSLQRTEDLLIGDEPLAWFASGVTPGSPNAANTPPRVALTLPAHDTTVTVPTAVTLGAIATDADGTVRRVEFYDGGTRIGEAITPPFRFVWSAVPPGVHTLTARAFDNGFASTDSTPVTLTAQAPPVSRIMPLGDSITQGGQGQASYRYPLFFDLTGSGFTPDFVGPRTASFDGNINAAEYPNYLTTFDPGHAGYWGFRVDEVLGGLTLPQIITAAPQCVLLHLGTNDVGENGTSGVTAAAANLPALIARLRQANPNIAIILAQVIPLQPGTTGHGLNAASIPALNARIMNLAAALDSPASPILVIDQFSGFDAANWLPDGVHPNLAGATFMAENWRAILNPVLSASLPTAPVIAHQPLTTTVVGGDPVTLSVNVGGHAPIGYQWRKGGFELAGATGPELTIGSAAPTDAGDYSVVISSPRGTATSATAVLTVTPAPIRRSLVNAGSVWKFRDTGENLGLAWRAPAYDDTGWTAGPAQLGYGESDEATRVEDNPTPGYSSTDTNRYITTYFRRSFQLLGASAVTGLRLSALRDDGVVVYLNGSEIWRDNLPGGAIAASTPASASIGGTDENTFFTTTLPASALALLTEGTNTLAVEIHQNAANSSDIGFDLSLTADLDPTPPTITSHPANRTVVAGWTTTFEVAATGAPPLTYQWLKDGQPIAGATGSMLALPAATAADAADYSVVVTNQADSVPSLPATLTVLPLPPVASALSSTAGTRTLTLSFPTDPAFTYDLLTSADLTVWTVVQTIIGQSGTAVITRSIATDGRQRFYQVRIRP